MPTPQVLLLELKSLCLLSPETWWHSGNRVGLIFISFLLGSALYQGSSLAPAIVDFWPLLCLFIVSGFVLVAAWNACSVAFEHARDEHTPSLVKKARQRSLGLPESCLFLRLLRG